MATTTIVRPSIAGVPPSSTDPGTLAKQFYDLSQAFDDFRMDNWDDLSPLNRGLLKDEAQALDTRAHYLTAQALGQLAASVQPQLAAISAVTAKAQDALDHLQKADSIITIATAVVALAAAVATMNVNSILTAVQTLSDSIASVVAA